MRFNDSSEVAYFLLGHPIIHELCSCKFVSTERLTHCESMHHLSHVSVSYSLALVGCVN